MAENPRSSAPALVSGVIYLSGLWGVGKTTLSLMCENPLLTTVLDLDQKSEERCEAMGIEYHSPSELGVADPLDYNLDEILEWYSATLNNLGNHKTTLVIDNASPLESGFAMLVEKNPRKYGVKPSNVAGGSFGGVNPGVGVLWERTIAYLRHKGYKRIFVIMHMSQAWTSQGPVPNRYKVKGNKTLNQLSNLSLILTRADTPGAPNAIVAKEALVSLTYDQKAGKWLPPVRALPPRIPNCTWETISDFIQHPRTEYEKDVTIPTTFEMSCYGQFMTPEQITFIKTVAANPNFKLTEEDTVEEEVTSKTFSQAVQASERTKCPTCGAAGASATSDAGHAPWCVSAANGTRVDKRKKP